MRIAIWMAALLLGLSLQAQTPGDVARGQIFYAHLLYEPLGFDGAVFTKLHTQSEWRALFEDEAAGFIALFGPRVDKKTREMLKSDHFHDRILPHLRAFALFYAKDRPATPQCESREEGDEP
jgi:hypothetical protein